jgi:hypothetical protein
MAFFVTGSPLMGSAMFPSIFNQSESLTDSHRWDMLLCRPLMNCRSLALGIWKIVRFTFARPARKFLWIAARRPWSCWAPVNHRPLSEIVRTAPFGVLLNSCERENVRDVNSMSTAARQFSWCPCFGLHCFELFWRVLTLSHLTPRYASQSQGSLQGASASM